MSDRQISFLVCDDVLVALNGKLFLQGVYTGDLAIAAEETTLGQLVVFLQISTPIQKPFRQLQATISFPGEPSPRTTDLMPLLPKLIPWPGRTMAVYKVPVPIFQPMLKAGPIEIHVKHEEGEVFVGRQWVMDPKQAQEFQKQVAASAVLRH